MFNEQVIETLNSKTNDLQQLLDYLEFLKLMADPESYTRELEFSISRLKQSIKRINALKENLRNYSIDFR